MKKALIGIFSGLVVWAFLDLYPFIFHVQGGSRIMYWIWLLNERRPDGRE